MTHKTKIVGISAIIYLLGALCAVAFMTIQVNRAGAELEDRVQVIANQLVLEQVFNDLADLVETTEDTRTELDSYLLSEADTIEFLAEIERVGVEQGVSLDTSALTVVGEGDDAELSIRFEITGSEPLVLRMIRILETLPYQSQLNTLRLTVAEETTADVTLNLALY